jgi:hypothetical protein
MIVWPIVGGAIAMSANAAIDTAIFNQRKDYHRSLAGNAVRIQRCALQYAEQHPDAGFPPAVAAMGPDGTKCLAHDDVAAEHTGYTVLYVPAPAEEDGRIPSFVVRGTANSDPRAGIFSVWGDSSATLRRGYVVGDEMSVPGDGIPVQLQSIRDCAEAMRADSDIPTTIGQLLAATKQITNRASYASRGCQGGGVSVAGDSVQAAWFAQEKGYRLSYARVGDRYRIEGRPAKYGESALRSYVLEDSGLVHFTSADRPATADDPELPFCAPYGVGDCTPTPLDVPPQAQFIHARSIPLDGAYWLHVRAMADTARRPVRLSWAIECNVGALGVGEPEPPRRTVNEVADVLCANPRYAKPPVGDSIIVRLWLRNDIGLTTHIDHAIRVAGDTIDRRN